MKYTLLELTGPLAIKQNFSGVIKADFREVSEVFESVKDEETRLILDKFHNLRKQAAALAKALMDRGGNGEDGRVAVEEKGVRGMDQLSFVLHYDAGAKKPEKLSYSSQDFRNKGDVAWDKNGDIEYIFARKYVDDPGADCPHTEEVEIRKQSGLMFYKETYENVFTGAGSQ
jgi:hypothetical protein